MLLTFTLIIISIPSPTHSVIPGLKPSFSANPSHCSLPFLLPDWLHGFPADCLWIPLSTSQVCIVSSLSVCADEPPMLADWLSYQTKTKHTHTFLIALFLGILGWASTRNVKWIWILLKQETVSVSGIIWAICKSAPHSRQTTMPAPHHSVFYRPDAFPVAQPTASKHWRQSHIKQKTTITLYLFNGLISSTTWVRPVPERQNQSGF